MARGINGITLFGGSAEAFFGFNNIGILLAVGAACRFRLQAMVRWVAPLGLAVLLLAATFRSNTLGWTSRDAAAFGKMGCALLAAAFAQAQAESFHPGSLLVAGAGAALAASGFQALGPDLAFFGAQLAPGLVDGHSVVSFPYSAVSHPMALGALLSLLGLRLHPALGPRFHAAFLALSGFVVALLAVELFDVHVPAGMDYWATYADFAKYHTEPANVYAHLVTTSVAYLGALGLAGRALAGLPVLSLAPAAAEAKAGAGNAGGAPQLGLLSLGLTWLFVRFTVPDDDVAHATVALMGGLGAAAAAAKPSAAASWGLIAAGVAGQELAHSLTGEVTFMMAYASEAAAAGTLRAYAGAAATFALHNAWLLPFEIRAAINAMTVSFVPAMAN